MLKERYTKKGKLRKLTLKEEKKMKKIRDDIVKLERKIDKNIDKIKKDIKKDIKKI